MDRKYSYQELEKYHRAEYPEEKMQEMSLHISNDAESMNYLAYLDEKASWKEDEEMPDLDISEMMNDPRLKNLRESLIPRKPAEPLSKPCGFGQIYRTTLPINWEQPYQQTRPVMVLTDDSISDGFVIPFVLVAPISFDTQYGTDEDILIAAEDFPLAAQVLLHAGITQQIFCHQLGEYLGDVPDKYDQAIKKVWKYTAGLDNGSPGKNFKPISSEEDIRVRYQRQEMTVTRYMREPVLHMYEVETDSDDLKGIDVTYILDKSYIEKAAREPERRQILAASSGTPSVDELLTGAKHRWTLIEEGKVCAEILRLKNELFLLISCSERGKDLNIEIKNNNGQVLLSEVMDTSAAGTDYFILRPITAFLNCILELHIMYDLVKADRIFRITHAML